MRNRPPLRTFHTRHPYEQERLEQPRRRLRAVSIPCDDTAEQFQMAVILVVEDEVFTREFAGMCIEDTGHAVLFASNIAEAVQHLQSRSVIDALFTDIYLGAAVFGGCEIANEGIVLRPSLRVLYTSGNAATAQLKSRFVQGSHFLGKPYTPAQLQTSIDGMLAN